MKATYRFIAVKQHDKTFYLCNIPAEILTEIAYASVRGRDDEEGAVQRVLNARRISNIKDFTLQNGYFPNSIVLHWKEPTEITINNDTGLLSFAVDSHKAQLIDGQHREAGLAAAIAEDESFAKFEVPVALYVVA